MVAIDASALVCYITRFTEENFATLVAVIFIYEAILNVFAIKTKFPMASADDVYDCVCQSPYDINDFNWTTYTKFQCTVSNHFANSKNMASICFRICFELTDIERNAYWYRLRQTGTSSKRISHVDCTLFWHIHHIDNFKRIQKCSIFPNKGE